MTKYGADQVSYFLYAGDNVVNEITELEDRREARVERTDALGDAWEEHSFVGIREGEIALTTLYEDTTDSIYAILGASEYGNTLGIGSTNLLTYCLEGTGQGANFVAAFSLAKSYQRLAQRDELIKAKVTFGMPVPTRQIYQGKVLWTYKAPAATGRQTAVDNSVSTTGGGKGLVQWRTTAGECNARIMHSSDDVTYAELMVFQKLTYTRGGSISSATGVIARYTAVDFTTASAAGPITDIKAWVGLARN